MRYTREGGGYIDKYVVEQTVTFRENITVVEMYINLKSGSTATISNTPRISCTMYALTYFWAIR